MKAILGENYDKFVESLSQPSVKAIYVNENKIAVKKFLSIVDFDVEPISYDNAGFYVDSDKKGRHPLHHSGAFYMQEPSAMFTVNCLKFRGDEKVLDMCAAPGGKSIQIANRIPNGVLVSNEIVKSRSEILFSNIERMGLRNVIISNDSPENIANAYGDCFDVVVVDAPCSGEGMFRKGEEVSQHWNEGLDEMCAIRQMEILKNADKTLKQNGYLIYSTCTYAVQENEEVVKQFLKEFDYELINIEYQHSKGIDLPQTVRLYPHENKGEGQFVALLKKKSENLSVGSSSQKLTNSKITNDFLKENGLTIKDVYEYKNYSYYTPDRDLVKKSVNYVSLGVRLGEVKLNRFEPYHNFFTAFGDNIKNQLELSFDDLRVKKYLRGETLDIEFPDGFGVVKVNGCSLGGFKMSKGKFKNHYPKGLRDF